MRRLIIWALVALQLVLVGLALDRIRSDPPWVNDQVDIPLSSGTPTSTSGTLESGLPLARQEAAAWDSSAKLVLVTEQVDWPLDPAPEGNASVAPGGWLTYVFAADSGRALSLELERLTGEVVRASEASWPNHAANSVLPLGQLPVTSDQAIVTVEAAIGREFRAQCPALRSRTILTLTTPKAPSDTSSPGPEGTPEGHLSSTPLATPRPPGDLVWLVTYADQGANDSVAFIASVDAETGQLVRAESDLDDGQTPCGM